MKKLGDVRQVTAPPVAADFANAGGTPLVVDVNAGSIYYMDTTGGTHAIAGGGGGGSDGFNRISAGTQLAGTLATIVFSNSNNVTFGMSNSSIVTASASFAQSTQPVAVSAANGSVLFSTLSFSNANGVSFSTSAGTALVASHNGLTTARASTDGVGLNTALTAGPLAWTVNSSGISLNASSAAGTTSGFSGNLISGSMTHNTAGLALSLNHPAWLTSQSNQAFSAGGGSSAFQTLSFADTNGVSFTNSNGSVGATVRTDYASSIHGHTITMFATSNTTQSSSGTVNMNSVIFAGAGIASVGVTNGSVVVSVPSGGGAGDGGVFAGVSNLGNTAGSTGTVSTGNFVLVGSNGISLSQSTGAAGSAATVTIQGAPPLSYFAYPPIFVNSQTMTMLQSTSGMFPFLIDDMLSFDFVRLMGSGSVLAASSTAATTGNTSYTAGHFRTHNLVLYSRGTGASSMSLQYVGSTSATERYLATLSCAANSTQFSYSNRYTFPHATGTIGFTKDYSSSAGSLNFHTSQLTDLTGLKVLDIQFNTSLQPGQYWLAYGISSTTSTGRTADQSRLGVAFTQLGVSQNTLAFGTLGSATNSSVMALPAHGSFTTAGGGTTSSVDMTRVSSTASGNILFMQFMRIA